jgi:DNA polymerase-4
MEQRLMAAGIHTPLQLRKAKPDFLRIACKSIVGYYWYQRLNFMEVEADLEQSDYKSMQAMRQVSAEKRRSLTYLNDLLISLCMTLEKRMVRNEVFCREITFITGYEEANPYKDHIVMNKPVQDGMEILSIIVNRMKKFQQQQNSGSIINTGLTMMSVVVNNFVADDALQYHLFENNVQKNQLRKLIYDVKQKHGLDKLMKAAELSNSTILRDAIGFGSVKDLHGDKYVAEKMKETEGDSTNFELGEF